MNRNTAVLFFHKLHEIVVEKMATDALFLAGELEVDESYCGGVQKGQLARLRTG